jgi:hypothetical protein
MTGGNGMSDTRVEYEVTICGVHHDSFLLEPEHADAWYGDTAVPVTPPVEPPPEGKKSR